MRKSRFATQNVPFKAAKKGRQAYPFSELTSGDYIIVPRHLARNASTAAYQFGKRHGFRVRCVRFGTKGKVKIYHTDR